MGHQANPKTVNVINCEDPKRVEDRRGVCARGGTAGAQYGVSVVFATGKAVVGMSLSEVGPRSCKKVLRAKVGRTERRRPDSRDTFFSRSEMCCDQSSEEVNWTRKNFAVGTEARFDPKKEIGGSCKATGEERR
eukprot:Pompholyxophrys_punicea_v1_NODE_293_length_2356_cov_6.226858.p3 type:complete len:134 gc:universal NODE_293_length_2356_cov_6.226858:536-135(-)